MVNVPVKAVLLVKVPVKLVLPWAFSVFAGVLGLEVVPELEVDSEEVESEEVESVEEGSVKSVSVNRLGISGAVLVAVESSSCSSPGTEVGADSSLQSPKQVTFVVTSSLSGPLEAGSWFCWLTWLGEAGVEGVVAKG